VTDRPRGVGCKVGGGPRVVEDLHEGVGVYRNGVSAGDIGDVHAHGTMDLASEDSTTGYDARAEAGKVCCLDGPRGSVDGEFAGFVFSDDGFDTRVGRDKGHL
jgi:hypothetical protein